MNQIFTDDDVMMISAMVRRAMASVSECAHVADPRELTDHSTESTVLQEAHRERGTMFRKQLMKAFGICASVTNPTSQR